MFLSMMHGLSRAPRPRPIIRAYRILKLRPTPKANATDSERTNLVFHPHLHSVIRKSLIKFCASSLDHAGSGRADPFPVAEDWPHTTKRTPILSESPHPADVTFRYQSCLAVQSPLGKTIHGRAFFDRPPCLRRNTHTPDPLPTRGHRRGRRPATVFRLLSVGEA